VDKRRRYRKLLETIMEVQAVCRTADIEDKEYVRYQVINEKICHCHNNENVSQIAGRCGVSLATVHKHLKSYMDVVQKYIA
jgi:predicted transcriptional regulator